MNRQRSREGERSRLLKIIRPALSPWRAVTEAVDTRINNGLSRPPHRDGGGRHAGAKLGAPQPWADMISRRRGLNPYQVISRYPGKGLRWLRSNLSM